MKRTLLSLALAAALFAPPAAVAQTPAPAPTEAASDPWTAARRLADEGRYDDALSLLERALAERPNDRSLLWLQAGVKGWSGRHAESVTLYESLIARHPDVADDVALDLARQRLDAGDVDAALADVERALRRAPMDRDARRLRALALSYANRLDEAAEVYRGLLSQDPQDVEARLGLARVRNWQGRHREAADRFRALQADGVEDPEVYRGLAYAEYWAGRGERARDPLRELLVRDARDPEAARLARDLSAERRPRVAFDFGQSQDTDDLEIRTGTAEYLQPVGERDLLSAQVRTDQVEDPAGRYDITRAGAGHQRKWSDLLSTHLDVLPQVDGPLSGGDIWLFDSWVTLRPSDGLRFDAGVGRQPVLSRQALDLGLTMTSLGASADWDATDRWSVQAMHRRNFYADGNDTWQTGAGVRYRALLAAQWRAYLGAEFQHLASQLDVDNGYYAPSAYVELGPRVEIEWTPAYRWSLGTAFRYGMQDEAGSERDDYVAAAARLEAPLGDRFSMVAEASHSDSRLASAAGYARDAWSLGVRMGF